MKYKKSICWIRRDLRLSDHRALYEACRNSEKVQILFVFDSTILGRLKDKKDKRVQFIHSSLEELQEKLKKQRASVEFLIGDPVALIPEYVLENAFEAVFTNEDYEPKAKGRDQKVASTLNKKSVDFHLFKDQVVFSGGEVLKKDGTPYKVFTPYKKCWWGQLKKSNLVDFKPDLKKLISGTLSQLPTLSQLGFESVELILKPGEKSAQRQLKSFLERVVDYHTDRDFPAVEGTSYLSVHLRFGTISIRECVRRVLASELKKSKGAQTWLSELIWREFYQMILDQFPYVEKKEFLPKFQGLKWPGLKSHYKAWCEGRTGYPIVDAAMRQLNETGWMHNRLRMIVASFLVKDLLVDWRWGEQYFSEKLLDFDLAANNGGWQWCASTGCDAQPYFRIFNPITQSKKFDPKREFIRTWVPELQSVSDKKIHWPHELGLPDYPPALVDHSEQREKALELYQI